MSAPQLSGQPILILKESATRTQGRDAQRANVSAARVLGELVRSSLGPKGMDKMLVDSFGDITITNDGATILKEMEIEHPAAKIMVEVAKTQDQEVGDGTTTAVLLASELLGKAQSLMEKNVHPSVIIEGFSTAFEMATSYLDKIAIKIRSNDHLMLRKIAEVALATKLVGEQRKLLANLVVDAVLAVAEMKSGKYVVDIEDVKIEKKAGGSVSDTRLIKGLLIDKEVVHTRMPKHIDNARIALIIKPLEIEKTEFDSKLSIASPEQLDSFLKKEENMLEQMVDILHKAGANVLMCQRGIDDAAQHFMAKRGILAIRRVKTSDMEHLAKATGGKVITEVSHLESADLGNAKLVEERKIGDDKMLFVEGCKNPKAVTIFIRGGTERIINEAERAIHDAICVVRDVVQEPKIVAGGGAPEAEVAKRLREYARKISGRSQLAVFSFSDALESIPMALAENAGLDPVDILVDLRSKHDKGQIWAGIDPLKGKVVDISKIGVYEPMSVKRQAIASSTEAATMILKIDEMIAVGKSEGGPTPPKPTEEGAGEEDS
ncbi:thermosome subunit beta [[Eubacterium] cellulosolvens]